MSSAALCQSANNNAFGITKSSEVSSASHVSSPQQSSNPTPISIEERFRNQLAQPAILSCPGLVGSSALFGDFQNNNIHNSPPIASRQATQPHTSTTAESAPQCNTHEVKMEAEVATSPDAAALRRPESARLCSERPPKLPKTGKEHHQCRPHSSPPDSNAGNIGIGKTEENCVADYCSQPAPLLFPQVRKVEASAVSTALDLSTAYPQPQQLARPAEQEPRRKRKASSRALSPLPEGSPDALLSFATPTYVGNCSPSMAKIALPASALLMNGSSLPPLLCGTDPGGMAAWTPHIAALTTAASLAGIQKSASLRHGFPIGAHGKLSQERTPEAMQLSSGSDDDWEAMMEISNTDEAEKIRELVGDNVAPVTDPNQCLVCRRILSCKSALQMHYRTHTGERPFKCRICSRAFTTKGNLKTHMGVHKNKHHPSSVHNNKGELLHTPVQKHAVASSDAISCLTHQCPICQKRFTSIPYLQQHIHQHTRNFTAPEDSPSMFRDHRPPLDKAGAHGMERGANNPLSALNPFLPFGLPLPPLLGTPPMQLPFCALFTPPIANHIVNGGKGGDQHQEAKMNFPFPRPTAETAGSEASTMPSPTEYNPVHSEEEQVLNLSLPKERDPPMTPKGTPSKSARPSAQPLPALTPEQQQLGIPFAALFQSVFRAAAMKESVVRGQDDSEQQQTSMVADAFIPALFTPTATLNSGLLTAPSFFRSPSVTGTQVKSSQSPGYSSRSSTPRAVAPSHLVSPNKPTPSGGSSTQYAAQCLTASSGKDSAAHTSPPPPSSCNDTRQRDSAVNNPSEAGSKVAKVVTAALNPLDGIERMCAEAVPEPTPRRSLPLSKHQCAICRKHFSSSSALQIHIRTHTGDKPFVCEVGYTIIAESPTPCHLEYQGTLAYQEQLHIVFSLFQICNRAFTTRGNLKVHMSTHDIHQQPSRRGRRIFDNIENPQTPLENGFATTRPRPSIDGGAQKEQKQQLFGHPLQFLAQSSPICPSTEQSFGLGLEALQLFNPLNPLLPLYQNALLSMNPLMASAVKNLTNGNGTAETLASPTAGTMDAVASFLKLLPLAGQAAGVASSLSAEGTEHQGRSEHEAPNPHES